MLYGSLNKHSSFSPEELLIVLFPSSFSLAGKISVCCRDLGVSAKDRRLLARWCLERCSFPRKTWCIWTGAGSQIEVKNPSSGAFVVKNFGD